MRLCKLNIYMFIYSPSSVSSMLFYCLICVKLPIYNNDRHDHSYSCWEVLFISMDLKVCANACQLPKTTCAIIVDKCGYIAFRSYLEVIVLVFICTCTWRYITIRYCTLRQYKSLCARNSTSTRTSQNMFPDYFYNIKLIVVQF